MTPHAMIALELACFVIVLVWVLLRLPREKDPRSYLARFVLLAVAAWLGEESCIRFYGFYAYSPTWTGFIDRVPVAIVCIWPVVVLSAMDLADALLALRTRTQTRAPHDAALTTPRDRFTFAALVMSLVIADASLIEPIAVASGLWHWTEPGPFKVPIIGIVGWGFFAFGVALVRDRPTPPWAVLVAGPVAAHGLLLASWWLGFRWLPRGTNETPFVVGACVLSVVLTVVIWIRRVELLRADLVPRIPGAVFFFVLLAVFARESEAGLSLVCYALAFAPPYLALTARARSPSRSNATNATNATNDAQA